MPIEPFGTYLSEINVNIQRVAFKEMHLKQLHLMVVIMLRPQCVNQEHQDDEKVIERKQE